MLSRGVDFDNDSAFMNELVVCWCRSQGLEVTRSRAYRKNDQAWVEQKNGGIVRRLVGYGRFVGLDATAALARLYDVVRLHGNLFQPSFKLREKTRNGARVIKRYHPPAPPAARVLSHPDVATVDKKRLSQILETADPVMLFAGIRAAQEDLGKRVDRRGLNAKPQEPVVIDLQRFAANLGTAWQAGETRLTHRRPYRRTKPYPKRPTMLDPFKAQIRTWIEEDPTLSPAEVLQRLMSADPSRFTKKCERTVQIAVKAWRAEITGRSPSIVIGSRTSRYRHPPRRVTIRRISHPFNTVTIFGEATGGVKFSVRLTHAMGQPLPMDLRTRLLAAIDAGMSRRAAAARFGVRPMIAAIQT